jgi:hypothetical protein
MVVVNRQISQRNLKIDKKLEVIVGAETVNLNAEGTK